MKAFLIVVAVCTIAFGCHKTGTTTHRPPELIGAWRWVQSSSLFLGASGTFYPWIGRTVILSLDADSSYTIAVDGHIGVSNSWRVDTMMTPSGIDTVLVFNNPSYYAFAPEGEIAGYQGFTIARDTMYLYSVTPGGSTEYKFVPYP